MRSADTFTTTKESWDISKLKSTKQSKYKDQIDQAQGPYTNLEVNRGRLVCKMSTLCPQGEGVHQFLHAVVMESLHSFSFSYILDL